MTFWYVYYVIWCPWGGQESVAWETNQSPLLPSSSLASPSWLVIVLEYRLVLLDLFTTEVSQGQAYVYSFYFYQFICHKGGPAHGVV